jgi:hypothetical protein
MMVRQARAAEEGEEGGRRGVSARSASDGAQ